MQYRATVKPLIDRVGRGSDLIGIEPEPAALVRPRAAQSSGHRIGSDDFLNLLERRSGRRLRPRKPGRKPRTAVPAEQLENGEIG